MNPYGESKLKTDYDSIVASCKFLKSKISSEPRIAIICGSGLGSIADSIVDKQVLPYEMIPNFPRSTVSGHCGNLIFGKLSNKDVVLMQGRFHMYEGYSPSEIAIPIRLFKLIGIKCIIITNAAGAISSRLKIGDMVIIRDHLNFPGLSGFNPLIGPNDERFGPRFPSISNAYDSELRNLFKSVAKDLKCTDKVHEGTYVFSAGPSYESVAETAMMKLIGADVVGMSTVPEVIVSHHSGIRVFALSLVTNIVVTDVEAKSVATHIEVLEASKNSAKMLVDMVSEMVARL